MGERLDQSDLSHEALWDWRKIGYLLEKNTLRVGMSGESYRRTNIEIMSRPVLIRKILGKLVHHKQKVPGIMPLAISYA